MMAVADYFLTPIGLAALAAAVPLLLLYLLRPEPARYALPTLRFLADDRDEDSRHAVLDRFRRDLLLLVQLLALVLVAVAIASPYVPVAEEATLDEAVVVVDATASMATETGAGTRFERGIERARSAVAGTTSVVAVDAGTTVVARNAPPAAANRALDGLRVTHTPGDLGAAITTATTIAGEDARIVIVSDFAGDGWPTAVSAARARGHRVDLEQVSAGGGANVGIVDAALGDRDATVTVRNFGPRPVERTVSLGARSAVVDVGPGDVATVSLPVPAGGGTIRLAPGDGFPVDDAVPVVAPADPTIEVLLVTNDRNRFLATALSLVDAVSLETVAPPTTITGRYDVVLFSNVEPDRVLPGNVESARSLVAGGGGVGIQAQPDVGRVGYRDLLLVDPAGLANGTTTAVADDPLTADITFPPPERYVTGSLRSGRALVRAGDGSPLVAIEDRGAGRVLYYGYIEADSAFKYNYRYPVFWKRAIHVLAGRDPIAALNRRTGTTWRLPEGTTVTGPAVTVTGSSVRLDRVGVYEAGDGTRVGAALLDRVESNVTAPALDARRDDPGGVAPATEERQVPRELTGYVAFAALGVLLLELGLLRRRGDL